MRALVWRGGRRLSVETLDAPPTRAGWARLAPAYAGLCGTDLVICSGRHPRARPGLVIGHEFVGRLLERFGPLDVGQPVFVNPLMACGECGACRAELAHACERLELLGIDLPGGAAEEAIAPGDSLVPLPASLRLRDAALIEPLAVAVRAVRRGHVGAGADVHVLGAGPIGLLVATCARAAGADRITIAEPAASRRAAAERLGFEPAAGRGADRRAGIVFDSTGHRSVAPDIVSSAATGGVVVIVGVHEGEVPLDLRRVTFAELTLVGSRVYTRSDVDAAIELLEHGRVPAEQLITSVVAMAQAPAAFDRLGRGSELKVLVEPCR